MAFLKSLLLERKHCKIELYKNLENLRVARHKNKWEVAEKITPKE